MDNDIAFIFARNADSTVTELRNLIYVKIPERLFYGYISITKTYYNPTNNTLKYLLVTPKTRKSRCKIIVVEEISNALKEHKNVQNQVIEQLGDDYYNKDFIFAKMERQHGYPIVIKYVRDRMNSLLKIADLNEHLIPHRLRHTHTSLLAETGVTLEQIWTGLAIRMTK